MAEIRDLNVSDASNTTRFPENQAPSTVNDGARALEGMLARALKDTIDGILISAGTGTAYTLAPNRSWTASATMDNGTEFFIRWHAACVDSPTLNVDTTDARQIRWPDGTTLSASDIIANSQGRVKYNSSLSCWVLMDAPVPAKTLFPAASETVAGKAELATQAETNTGTDDARIVTPLKLTTWTPGVGTVTVVSTDKVLLADASASGILKQGLVSDITALVATGLVFISAQNPSAAASVSFTGLSSTYEVYVIEGYLVPATDDVQLWVRLDANGGASFDAGASDYDWHAGNDTGGFAVNDIADAQINLIADSGATFALGNAATEGVSFTLRITRHADAAAHTNIAASGTFKYATGVATAFIAGGTRLATQADDAIQFLMESGNLTGHLALYGLKKA